MKKKSKKVDLDDPVVKDILAADEGRGAPTDLKTSQADSLHDLIIVQLKTVYDPEIPVDIYDLGLIYNIDIQDDNHVHLQMTLTTPGCPVAQTFPETVRQAILKVEAVNSAEVELVWDPPWTPERMSEAARLELGFFP